MDFLIIFKRRRFLKDVDLKTIKERECCKK